MAGVAYSANEYEDTAATAGRLPAPSLAPRSYRGPWPRSSAAITTIAFPTAPRPREP
jgi:hypothetical protein